MGFRPHVSLVAQFQVCSLDCFACQGLVDRSLAWDRIPATVRDSRRLERGHAEDASDGAAESAERVRGARRYSTRPRVGVRRRYRRLVRARQGPQGGRRRLAV